MPVKYQFLTVLTGTSALFTIYVATFDVNRISEPYCKSPLSVRPYGSFLLDIYFVLQLVSENKA